MVSKKKENTGSVFVRWKRKNKGLNFRGKNDQSEGKINRQRVFFNFIYLSGGVLFGWKTKKINANF